MLENKPDTDKNVWKKLSNMRKTIAPFGLSKQKFLNLTQYYSASNFYIHSPSSLIFQDLSMIAPSSPSPRAILQVTKADSPTLEPAVLEKGQENSSEVMTSSPNGDGYDTADDADFWNMVIQEEKELSRVTGNPDEKKNPPNIFENVCATRPDSPLRASDKSSLKRKLADPRTRKDCGTSSKKKVKEKGTKRRRISKKNLFDYHASLELGTKNQCMSFARNLCSRNTDSSFSHGNSCPQHVLLVAPCLRSSH